MEKDWLPALKTLYYTPTCNLKKNKNELKI